MKKREILIILFLLTLIIITLEVSPGLKVITNKAAAPFIPTTDTDTEETHVIKELKVPTREEKFSIIKKGEEVVIDLGQDSPFIKIHFKAKEDLQDITIRIEETKVELEEKVYKSIQIEHNQVPDSKIENVVLEIQVPKQWLELNNQQSKNVFVKRYTKEWQDLPTTQLKEDKSVVYYIVKSPGLSIFSIVAQEKEEVPNTSKIINSVLQLSKERPLTLSVVITMILALTISVIFYLKTRPKKRFIKKKKK